MTIEFIANKRFGDNLADLRETAKLSNEELAKRVGVSPETVLQWESGAALPDEAHTRKLEEVLDWPLFLPPAFTFLKIGDWEKQVNERLAPLAREMLIAGFPTRLCYVDNLGVTIGWRHPERAADFLNIVTRYEKAPDSMYSRAENWAEWSGRIPRWDYDFSLHDLDRLIHESDGSRPQFTCILEMCIPPQDVPTVIARLRDHNQTRLIEDGTNAPFGRDPNRSLRRVHFPLPPAHRGPKGETLWAIPISEDTSMIANIPAYTDAVAFHDLVRISPGGDLLEILERVTYTVRAMYQPASSRKEQKEQWKAIRDYFEKHNIDAESGVPGAFMMAVPLDVDEEDFDNICAGCPVNVKMVCDE